VNAAKPSTLRSHHRCEAITAAKPSPLLKWGKGRAMIKDLVVNLNVGTDRDRAAQFAISIASRFDAHIAGIAFAYDPAMTPNIMDGLSAAWIDAQRAENLAAAQQAVDRFEAAVRRCGISAEHRIIDSSLGSAANRFGQIARQFDLSVVGQTAPDLAMPEDLIIEAALFESGRPVVVVPYIQQDELKLDHILVCWDHSRNAARAVADALPFLAQSKKVEIVMVTRSDAGAENLPGAGLADHLARHNLNIELKSLIAPDMDVTNTVLSYAADCGADFIVMGGYGHSRLREFVLGGTTRGMLQSMTIPVLMAH
jgi:nucleotide-binding universal stress UspA family protein